MADRLIYASGMVRPADTAWLAREAAVLSTGAGIFETVLVADGEARATGAHVDRMLVAASGLGLGLRESREQLLDAVRAVAAAARRPWARLRIIASQSSDDAEVLVTSAPYRPPSPAAYVQGVRVALESNAGVRRADETRRVKSLAWRRQGEALIRAASGSFDVLLINDSGRLAEGARSNVVVRRSGVATTPPLSEGCLPGTVRQRLLAAGAVREGEVDLADVMSGGEVVLTNSLVGVIPVARIEQVRCEVVGLADELRATYEAAQAC